MSADFLFRAPDQLNSRASVMTRPCPVPKAPGVYAWFFRQAPDGIDASKSHRVGDLTLLYVGISPKEPPLNGRPPSRSTLRQRLRTHYAGNAAGSTLRRTLGCLLADRLGLELRRVGSGDRLTFTNPGEQTLDAWMAENAFVSWHALDRPWDAERQLLGSGLSLPLNLRDNPDAAQVTYLSSVRRRAVERALALPTLPDSGGPRTGAPSHL